MKRYVSEQYKDFWTNILDEALKVTPTSRKLILKWGSEQFEPAISNCKSSTIKTLLQCMQELTEKFVTPPETGDNRFIFQPLFQNKNLKYQKQNHKRKRLVTFQQLDFKLPSNTAVTINELYNMEKFISYEEFCEKISFIHEGGYLALKFHINGLFKRNGKYPPPVINKSVQEHNIESLTKLFEKKEKDLKNLERCFLARKRWNLTLLPGKKTLKDYSITHFDIKNAHEFNSNKILHPKYHDKKFRLLARKTQFNDQLTKHNPSISENCQYCESTQNGTIMHIKEDMEHALFSCQNVKTLPQSVLTNLKLENFTQLPITASQLVLYDNFCRDAKTLINSVWLLLTCFILSNRLNKAPNNSEKISKKIKETIKATNKAYPNRNLARECQNLNLDEFLASHEIGLKNHWSTFETFSKLWKHKL